MRKPFGEHNIQSKPHRGLANRKHVGGGVASAGCRVGGNPTTGDILGERFLERFSAFVNKTATCWLWTASVYGYGQIARRGKTPIKAHRAAWMLAHGPISSEQHVLHRCDTPHCVNPNHLFLGDQAANMKDAAAKGRLSVARPNLRRLSNAAMAAIVSARAERGVVARLARQFGVTKGYVSLLRSGQRAWRTA